MSGLGQRNSSRLLQTIDSSGPAKVLKHHDLRVVSRPHMPTLFLPNFYFGHQTT